MCRGITGQSGNTGQNCNSGKYANTEQNSNLGWVVAVELLAERSIHESHIKPLLDGKACRSTSHGSFVIGSFGKNAELRHPYVASRLRHSADIVNPYVVPDAVVVVLECVKKRCRYHTAILWPKICGERGFVGWPHQQRLQ